MVDKCAHIVIVQIWPTVTEFSIPKVQSLIDSLQGEKIVFPPENSLVDSGGDISVCFDCNRSSHIEPTDVIAIECMPAGSTPMDVLGKGIVRM